MKKEIKTVENQKVGKVVKAKSDKSDIYGIINKECAFKAMQELTYNEFKVYLYMTLNQDGYEFAISPKYIMEMTGISDESNVRKIIRALIKKGYCIEIGNIRTFYEDSRVKSTLDDDMSGKIYPSSRVKNTLGVGLNLPEGRVKNTLGVGLNLPYDTTKMVTEYITDITYNNTYNNTDENENNLLDDEKEKEQKQPTRQNYDDDLFDLDLEPKTECTSLDALVQSYKGNFCIKNKTINEKLSTIMSSAEPNLDVVKELFDEYIEAWNVTDTVSFSKMLTYANNRYDERIAGHKAYEQESNVVREIPEEQIPVERVTRKSRNATKNRGMEGILASFEQEQEESQEEELDEQARRDEELARQEEEYDGEMSGLYGNTNDIECDEDYFTNQEYPDNWEEQEEFYAEDGMRADS